MQPPLEADVDDLRRPSCSRVARHRRPGRYRLVRVVTRPQRAVGPHPGDTARTAAAERFVDAHIFAGTENGTENGTDVDNCRPARSVGRAAAGDRPDADNDRPVSVVDVFTAASNSSSGR